MGNKRAIALLAMIAVFALPAGAPAAPLSQALRPIRSADLTLVTQVESKSGSVIRSTGQLRAFRPFQVPRIRPTFTPNKIRPGRPLAQRKRPRRPGRVHVAGGVPPQLPPAIYEDNSRDVFPYSPDFCRYWEDRGVVVGDFEPCW